LPDEIFHTKTTNLGKFWLALKWKMLVHICFGHFERERTIGKIGKRAGGGGEKKCFGHLEYFTFVRYIVYMVIWYI
jgi:hypothetical protein